MRQLDAHESGLSDAEAESRLRKYGLNKLPETPPKPLWKRLISQYHNVLIYMLIAAGTVNAFLAEWVDAGVIFAVVIINGFVGFIQEGKAEKALDAIRKMLSLTAIVRRGDDLKEIPATELVPGDIVFLQSGDKVPADMRLIDVKSLRVEEASLTGESHPVEKQEEPVVAQVPLGDRASMAYSGTLVVYGQAEGVVTATGLQTELGRINELMESAPALMTPLIQQLNRFGHTLTIGILGFGVVAMFIAVMQGMTWVNSFKAMVGMAVAAIPEGLPTVVTITLAIGVQAMARRNAIIRRLQAVETLGSVGVICSDKTGTLTRNEMTVTTVVLADEQVQVEGVGYEPEGRFLAEDGRVIEPVSHPILKKLLEVGVGCNDSRLKFREEAWQVEGDPTEAALLALASKAGWAVEDPEDIVGERLDSIPFESQHKYMATLHENGVGYQLFLKGAPEEVLDLCNNQIGAEGEKPLDRVYWEQKIKELAAKGQRLLGFAVRQLSERIAWDEDEHELTHEMLGNGENGTAESAAASKDHALTKEVATHGFVFLGLAGLIDPPRREVIASIRQCQEAGIRVKMITGDHAMTAQAIGHQLGLNASRVVTGDMLDSASKGDIQEWVDEVDVFARVSPEHKLRLVEALQANGKITAMTGDGVNDAPALKTANVGIAMGIKGSEVSKEASAMVLADDNFASIAHAVEEGRTVYDNLKKCLMFILPTAGGQALVILVAMLFGIQDLPITTAQILWVNMIVAVTLGIVLSFEPAEKNVMKRPPRDPDEPLLSGFFLWRIGFVSVLLCVLSFGFFEIAQEIWGLDLAMSRSLAVNAIIMGQIFYLLNCRLLTGSVWRYFRLPRNPYVGLAIVITLVAQLLFTYTPWMQKWFEVSSLPIHYWLWLVIGGFILFAIVESEKRVLRRMEKAE